MSREHIDTLFIEPPGREGKITRTINLTALERVKYKDLVAKSRLPIGSKSPRRRAANGPFPSARNRKDTRTLRITGAVFEKLIEPDPDTATFVTHLPKELVRRQAFAGDPSTSRCSSVASRPGDCAAYTEQNDPIEQRDRLEHQAGGEQQKLDEDFLARWNTACRRRAAWAWH